MVRRTQAAPALARSLLSFEWFNEPKHDLAPPLGAVVTEFIVEICRYCGEA